MLGVSYNVYVETLIIVPDFEKKMISRPLIKQHEQLSLKWSIKLVPQSD